MKNFFLVLLLASAALFALVGLSESWWGSRRRRRRPCTRQDCVLYDWTNFGSCSAICGWGYVNQRKNIRTNPSCGGTQCPSSYSSQRKRTRSCYSGCCRVNCLWTWNSWSPCQGCGTSYRTRTMRISRNPSCGGTACPSRRSETRSCYTGVCCPVNCAVSSWSSWGSCNAACGQTGNRARTRRITTQPSCKGSPCPTLTDTKSCYGPCCPGDC